MILWATFSPSIGLAATDFTQLDFKRNAFSVITQSNGHYAVHSRPPILVATESDFLLVNDTNLHPVAQRVSKLLLITGPIFAVAGKVPL